jgi:hypothetical protein
MAPQFAKMQSCHQISTAVLAPTWPVPYANGVELTATQLLNSGWRSPSEACTAGARARTRHRKEISRTGGAKSRRSILHVQRCRLCYVSVKPKHNDPWTPSHVPRPSETRNDRGTSARAVRLGKALAAWWMELFFFPSCMSIQHRMLRRTSHAVGVCDR